MRYLVIFVFSFSLAFSLSTTAKINKNKKNLTKTSHKASQIHKKLNIIANDIIKNEKYLLSIDKKIKTLQEHINDLRHDAKSTQNKLYSLNKENKHLIKTRKDLERKIINIIADKFAFYLVTDRGYQESIESIIGNEVLSKMDVVLKKDFAELNRAYDKTNDIIQKHSKEIKNIQKSLQNYKDKQKSLRKLKLTRQKSVAGLKKQKNAYKRKLDMIIAQRNELKKTMEQLKILKVREDEQRRRAKSIKGGGKVGKVRRVGSSYHQSRVKRYRGRKTIAPLKSYYVKQKFGNYIDPLYRIKIFNESVVLSSNIQNAKVRNVLDGKVIFAKDTAMLDKVVIVENRIGIHTIYAHLDKIAPNIKVGSRVKKGYYIGRVDRDLTFEVTQKNYHINPMELIR